MSLTSIDKDGVGGLCMRPGLSEWFENVQISSTQGNKMNCTLQVLLNRNREELFHFSLMGVVSFPYLNVNVLSVAHQNPGFGSTTKLYIWVSPSWNIRDWSLWKFLPKLLRLQETVSRFYTLSPFACMHVHVPNLPRISDELG